MSLRTRRGLALGFSLMLVVVACTGTTTPTASPQGPTAPTATTPAATTPPGTAPAATTPPGTEEPVGTDEPGASPDGTAGPGTSPPVGGPPDEDQTLRLYLGATDPPTLDPNAAEDTQSISVLTAIHRGLLYWDAELGVVPSLAEALPEISEDGLTLTFTLRSDATYSNGDPIVADDLVFGWKRLVDPRLANPYRYVM